MKTERFYEILENMKEVKIAVLGDLFLDRIFYVDRQWDEISVETGLTAYQVKRKISVPGAAGVATNNLSALGIKRIYGMGILSNDGEGFELEKGLKQTGVDTTYMIRTDEFFTPTYTKTFFEDSMTGKVEETHRIDIKNRNHLTELLQKKIVHNIRVLEEEVDAFVCLEQLEDGECGVFGTMVREELARVGREGRTKVFVDSRYHIRDFSDVMIKCNDLEVLRAVGDTDIKECTKEEYFQRVEKAMDIVAMQRGTPVIVSCGEEGMKICRNGKTETIQAYPIQGEIDVCGAGDSALAGISAAYCAGADLQEAALMGNLVASLIVQQIGVTGLIDIDRFKQRFYEYTERWKEV